MVAARVFRASAIEKRRRGLLSVALVAAVAILASLTVAPRGGVTSTLTPGVAPPILSWTHAGVNPSLARSLPTTIDRFTDIPYRPSLPSSPEPALSGPPALNVGTDPFTAVYDGGNGYVYVVNFDSENVSVISGTRVIGTINASSDPYGATYDSGNGYVYVSNSNAANVSVINGIAGLGTVTGMSEPQPSAYDTRNGYVYVPNYASDNVSLISGTSVEGWVNVGFEPQGATFDSGNGFVYVPSYEDNDVYVLNGTAIEGLAAGGVHPTGATYDPTDGFVYVANDDSSVVYVINGTTSDGLVQVGTDPESATYDSANGYLYVLNAGSNNVSVISGKTVVGTVDVGTDPVGGAYDSGNGDVYVANSGSANVSVLSGTKAIGTVKVGSRPECAVFDSGNGDVYTLNAASDNVSVIGPPIVTLVASPSTTQVGEASILTLGFADGVAPISWTLEENGSVANISSVSGGQYSFTPLHAGSYTFYLNATDAVGGTSKATTITTVKAALVASLTPNPGSILAGQFSTLSYGFSGGVAPITWTLAENGSTSNLSTGTPGGSYTFVSAHEGTYTFYLNASDSVGSLSNVTATVVVSFAALSSNPGTIDVGESSTLSYSFTEGAEPVVWTLTENGSASNLTGASGGSYTFAPTNVGVYTFYLNATDAAESTAHLSATVTVEPAPAGGSGTPTLLGLPQADGIALIGALAAIVVVGLLVGLIRRRRHGGPPVGSTPPSTSAGGSDPATIPPPPPGTA
ncbi:MAG: hypothetical protein ACLQD9_00565 [Thermoplasmata archaeon]